MTRKHCIDFKKYMIKYETEHGPQTREQVRELAHNFIASKNVEMNRKSLAHAMYIYINWCIYKNLISNEEAEKEFYVDFYEGKKKKRVGFFYMSLDD